MRFILPMLAAIALLTACGPPSPAEQATADAEAAKLQAQEAEKANAAEAQKGKEQAAEQAFAEIDSAETAYPPAGGDPTQYNANLTRAYHAWEHAALVAYGPGWKDAWVNKHQGSGAACELLHKTGMPLEDCYAAAAREGVVEPLEDRLMKCPSFDPPDGGIIQPTKQEDCDKRARWLQVKAAQPAETPPDRPAP
jgi:hypothetical protein